MLAQEVYHVREDRQSVVCWGERTRAIWPQNLPASVVSVAQVSSGNINVCVLKTDGTVVCWGDNSWGTVDVPRA